MDNMKVWAVPVIALVVGLLVGFFVSDLGLLGEGFNKKYSTAITPGNIANLQKANDILFGQPDPRMREWKCAIKCFGGANGNSYLYYGSSSYGAKCICGDEAAVNIGSKGPVASTSTSGTTTTSGTKNTSASSS